MRRRLSGPFCLSYFRARFTTARADEPFRFLGVAFEQTCPFLSTPQWLHMYFRFRAAGGTAVAVVVLRASR